jgi:acyl-CoA synthetase (NDP forming)
MLPSKHPLAPLLAPRSLAMLGASARVGSYGHGMILAAESAGFEGSIYLVNPRYEEIDGRPCFPSLGELPETPEHVVIMLAPERVEAALDATIASGAKAVTLFASSDLEGDSDPPLRERLRAKVRAAGLRMCGGNGMGFYNRVHQVRCAMVDGPREQPGSVALISQSGSILTAMGCNDGRLAFNLSVSSGQEIVTTAAEYVDFALELESTRVIALFLETIRNPAAFAAAAEKAAARGVPIAAVKVARTEQSAAFAASHSGAIAGDDAAYDAFFERYGVLRCDDVDELFATCQLLSQPWRVGDGGIAVITDSGGERELLVDSADAAGVRFADISERTRERLAGYLEYGLAPENPLDAWGSGKGYQTIFGDSMRALLDDSDTALGVWVTDLRDGDPFRGPFVEESQKIAAQSDTPLVFATCFSSGLDSEVTRELGAAGVPVLEGMRPSLAAVRNVFDYRDGCTRPALQPPASPAGDVIAHWRERIAVGAALDEAEGYALLRAFGVPALEAQVVESAADAVAAARATGFPVALKTAMPGIAHKSDVGGVLLGLADAGAVESAYTEMTQRLGPRVLLTPMAEAGSEIVFGKVTDAQFGPLVMIGSGGVFVEILEDVRFAVPPIDVAWARRMIDSLQGRKLLDGARGRPAADIGVLAEAFAHFSVLAATLHDVLTEIDVNPVIAGPSGVAAVDVLLVANRG